MELDKETLETVAKTTLPYAKLLFETYVQPTLADKLRSLKRNKGLRSKIEKAVHVYLSEVYAQCAYVTTIAFQNTPKRLLDIYVPLKLIRQDDHSEIEVNGECTILDTCPSILVVDNAGMGKSVIARRLALKCLMDQSGIPVVVDLHSFSEDTNLAKDLLSTLAIESVSGLEILPTLPLVLVFDGLDEVPLRLRKDAAKEIMRVRELCPKSPTIVTSRPDPCTRLLRGLTTFSVKSLSKEKAFALLRKYDRNGTLARKLISGIERDHGGHIQGFLTTPLYVSLLYCAYRFKPVIPRRKHLFYSEVYDALFETHDLSKEPGFVHQKHSGLDSADFHCVLRRLSFWCLSKDFRLEFLKDELELSLKRIEETTPGVYFKPGEFIKDLVETVPLFIREGNKLRWSHKALMEYFAAMFICHDTKSKQAQILRKLYGGNMASSYLSVMELCADIDYATFRKVIVAPLLGQILQHSEHLVSAFSGTTVRKRDIRDRAGLTFDRKIAFRLITTKSTILKSIKLYDGSDEPASFIKAIFEDKVIAARLWLNKKGFIDLKITILMAKDDFSSIIAINSGVDTAILHFLEDKEPDLFCRYKDKKAHGTSKQKELSELGLPRDKSYVVDAKLDCQLNIARHFVIFNELLKEVLSVWPDVTAAKKIHNKILQDKTGGLDRLLAEFT